MQTALDLVRAVPTKASGPIAKELSEWMEAHGVQRTEIKVSLFLTHFLTHTYTHTHTLSLSLSLSFSFFLSFFLSIYLSSSISTSRTHTHIRSLSLTLTLSFSLLFALALGPPFLPLTSPVYLSAIFFLMHLVKSFCIAHFSSTLSCHPCALHMRRR